MLLDEILPKYDFTEVHSLRIKATPETAYRVMKEMTMSDMSWIVAFLMNLRELPEKLIGRKAVSIKNKPLFDENSRNGFVKLAEKESSEYVFGMIVPGDIGRVWKKTSGVIKNPSNAEDFFAYKNPDFLWVVANMLVEETGAPGWVNVRTESRTMALSPRARKRFAPYWRIIRPFSGLIRRLMLRAIKRLAEKT